MIALDAPSSIVVAGRILGRAGLCVNVANHVSTMDGGRMYVNCWGNLARLRPEGVLSMALDGTELEGTGPVNDTIVIHRVLHRLLPTAQGIVHTHAPAAVTLGAFHMVPNPYDQESCYVSGQIGVLEGDFPGLVLDEALVEPMAAALADRPLLLLPNHGAIAIGETLPRAVLRMIDLEHACRRHIEVNTLARSLKATPRAIRAPMARTFQQAAMSSKGQLREQLRWKDLCEQVLEADPGLLGARR